jgi:hypothetical protein
MDNKELLQRIRDAFWGHVCEHGSLPYDLYVHKYKTGEPRVPKPQVAIEVKYVEANKALTEALSNETALNELKYCLEFHLSPAGQDRYMLTISMREPKTSQV